MDYINMMPDHILVEIIGNLSTRMIKECCLVCKRWNETIGSSTKLMRRFKLHTWTRNEEKQNAKKHSQRNHQHIIVPTIKESLDVITHYNLQSLDIYYSRDDTKLSLLIDALNNMPTLKTLKSYGVSYIDDISGTDNRWKKIQTNLIELSFNLSQVSIFDCCSIEIFRLFWQRNVGDDKKKLAVEFLHKQRNLKVLEVSNELNGEFFLLPGIFDAKFQLKKFSYFQTYYNDPTPFNHYELYIKFLERHKNSLTNLDFRFHTEPQFGIEFLHKYVLENIINLKHLGLGYCKIEGEEPKPLGKITYNEIHSATQITENLESLTVRAFSSDMNENMRFFGMFPNLKRLEFHLPTNKHGELLECISQRCVNLESLYLDYLGATSRAYFPNLKELNIRFCTEEEEDIRDFIRRHSQTLEKIIIDEYEIETNKAFKEILKCRKLNFLKFRSCCIRRFVLRQLHKLSQKRKSFTLKGPFDFVPYNFPDDKAIWNDDAVTYYNQYFDGNCEFNRLYTWDSD